MNIKNNKMFIITLCMTASFIINLSVRNADSKIITNVPADVSGVETRALVVEDFENFKVAEKIEEDGWFVSSNPKEFTKGDDETKKRKNPVLTCVTTRCPSSACVKRQKKPRLSFQVRWPPR